MEAVRGRVKSLEGDDQAVAETLLELFEDLQDDTETEEILPTNSFSTGSNKEKRNPLDPIQATVTPDRSMAMTVTAARRSFFIPRAATN
jgi:hypothetical protein